MYKKKVDNVELKLKSKQDEVDELIQRTPPTEFTEKLEYVKDVVNEICPTISVDFHYDEIAGM